MSDMINIVINDGATPTPVAHTFAPNGFTGVDQAVWQDRATGIIDGFSTLRMTTRRASSKNSGTRVSFQLDLPVLAQTSPSTSTGIQPNPTRAYTLIASAEFVLPKGSSIQNRKDLLTLFKNALANAVVTEAVIDYNPPH